MIVKNALRALIGVTAATACSAAFAAATITIVNADAAGEGFNDPTVVAPVGTNTGTTLGQQRVNAFQYAASLWGAKLNSNQTIFVQANFDPLSCTATGAVLGSAGPTTIFADFPGAILAGTWYHGALADKLADDDLAFSIDSLPPGFPDIAARFNSNLGNVGCLTGVPFYLGLGSPAPAGQIDLIAVLLHEFGHGLGFSTVTSTLTGEYFAGLGLPSAYDHFLNDNTQGLGWVQMTAAQRMASAINPRNVVWTGANVTTAAPNVLVQGTPKLRVLEPASIAGDYLVGTATFGPAFETIDLTRQTMPVVEGGFLGLACAPFDAANKRAAKNRIAVVLRGVCGFVVKVKNAQDAGAVGVIVIDNAAGGPPAGLGGADPTITIPSLRVTLADGITLLNGMNFNIPSSRSVNEKVRFFSDPAQLAGADALDRVMIFTPNPRQAGSSVSHWDTSATRNLLMEPSINADLTQSVEPPEDLTLPMFTDLGW
jgi:hypothetical protein